MPDQSNEPGAPDRRVAQRRTVNTADYKGPERRMSERRDTCGPLYQK